jgi:hypothetical protein
MAYHGRELLRRMPSTGDPRLAGAFLCATLATLRPLAAIPLDVIL